MPLSDGQYTLTKFSRNWCVYFLNNLSSIHIGLCPYMQMISL